MSRFSFLHRIARYWRLGSFMALRQIRRGSIWINILIISIMTLTFLSLVVIPGVLVGLTEGSFRQNREYLTGDIYISTLPNESSILNTQDLVRVLDFLPEIESYSVRYKVGTQVEAGYLDREDFTKDSERLSISAFVIHPEQEDNATNISDFLIEGEMLSSDRSGELLIGSTLLEKYSSFADLFEPLKDIEIGQPVKLTLQGAALEGIEQEQALIEGTNNTSGQTSEFIVRGILDSKVGELSSSVFITEQDYRRITGNTSLQANEIAIKHNGVFGDDQIKSILISYGFDQHAKIQTADEAIPKFLSDIQKTFGILGNVIGFVGIAVSSITIFIVIYINALTRRKFIGILKGIGISEGAIEASYVIQSIFYSLVGIGLGMLILYAGLVPFFAKNPIDFPFSDGILVADIIPTLVRAVILIVVTMLAGYLPARIIVHQNTLDSILQR